MNCGCEHGMKCTKVAACGVDDMISEAVLEAESKWEDKYWAFVERVKALAEGMDHQFRCDTWNPGINNGCTCIRGELLALCGEVK